MPTLNWIGKEKIINHHNDVPFKLLDKKYTYGDNNNENMIIHGDNLYALKALLPKYENSIDCIYIDPPYNTGEEKWVYNDNVNDPRILKWLGEVVGKEGEDLSRHDKWLCMMYPRLKILQKLMVDDGRIFISIDENELYNLKQICDEIFGPKNFVGQYMWFKSATPPNLSHKIKKNLEYIVCYEKSKNNTKYQGIKKESASSNGLLNQTNRVATLVFPPNTIKTKLKDGLYKANRYGTKSYDIILEKDAIVLNGFFTTEVVLTAKFKWAQSYLEQQLREGTEIFIQTKTFSPSYEKREYDPEVPPNLIDISVGVDTTEEAGKRLKEMFGANPFDYPKDVNLIKYLINFVPKKDAIVLDCFAGSGTTGQAVLELNNEDGGNRHFIEVEMMDYAETIVAERIRKITTGFDGYEPISGGFSFYELGEQILLENGNLNSNISEHDVKQFIYYTETHSDITVTDNDCFMGASNETAYYIFYEKNNITCLNMKSLEKITIKADSYVVYADTCTLSKQFLESNHIVFKKIPRDIQKL